MRRVCIYSWLTVFLLGPMSGTSMVRITQLDRNGTLTWTNTFCTSRPAYEILRATTIAGEWQHVAYMTNQHAFTLTSPLPGGSSTAFYRIAWIDDDPVVMDYAYDEHGIGEPSVIGTLSLHLPTMTAAWFFEETEFNTSPHPLGVGFGGMELVRDELTIVLRDVSDDGVYLEGELRSSPTQAGCGHTYTGIVYWINLAGTDPIGVFEARE